MLKLSLSTQIQSKMPLLIALALSSGLSVTMWLARALYTQHWGYFFLNWNLFLAWIPLVFALLAWMVTQRAMLLPLVLALLAGWLLFLPNSPYIVTDLMHLRPRGDAPIWYDALLVFSYAWNGLIVGMTSVWIVQSLVQRWFGGVAGWLLAGGALFASAFGIYLGRFLRWNSWDLLTDPKPLLRDVVSPLLNPLDHPRTLVVTLILSGLLFMIYVTMTLLAQAKWEPESAPSLD